MLKKSSLDFLRHLAKNNNREWFMGHKQDYEAAKADLLGFITQLIPRLAAIDPCFAADTPSKKCLLRIYRDIRFRADKTPYKTNYGIVFDVKGYGPNTPSYYLHLEPGSCFFGAGFWMPEKDVLKKIREEIDYCGTEFEDILHAAEFRSMFSLSFEDSLKKAPKGYEMDNPMLKYIRLKSFIVSYPLQEQEFYSANIVDKLSEAFKTIQPFIQFLRKAVDN